MLCSKIDFDVFAKKIIPVSLLEINSLGYEVRHYGQIVSTANDNVYLKCYLYKQRQKSHYGHVWITKCDFDQNNQTPCDMAAFFPEKAIG